MSELDALPDQFEGLLDRIGTECSLEELRYAFRKVIYSFAMKILEDFPEVIIGPPPPPPLEEEKVPGHGKEWQPPPAFSASTKPPYRPSAVLLACIALGNCPPQET